MTHIIYLEVKFFTFNQKFIPYKLYESMQHIELKYCPSKLLEIALNQIGCLLFIFLISFPFLYFFQSVTGYSPLSVEYWSNFALVGSRKPVGFYIEILLFIGAPYLIWKIFGYFRRLAGSSKAVVATKSGLIINSIWRRHIISWDRLSWISVESTPHKEYENVLIQNLVCYWLSQDEEESFNIEIPCAALDATLDEISRKCLEIENMQKECSDKFKNVV